jgi:MarR family transcriptional regulator, lower aerobic nicotinate degradation pathway regulator
VTTDARSPQDLTLSSRATDTPGDASPFALGLLMRRAHDRAAGALVEALRPLGLELRHFAVMIALNNHGPLSQSGLVQVIGSDKASMVRVVDDLERAGLVRRKPVPHDRRMHAVELTAHGLETFDTAHVDARPISDRLVSHLKPGEAEQLLDLLTRFTYPPAEPGA